LVRRSRLYPL